MARRLWGRIGELSTTGSDLAAAVAARFPEPPILGLRGEKHNLVPG